MHPHKGTTILELGNSVSLKKEDPAKTRNKPLNLARLGSIKKSVIIKTVMPGSKL